MVEAHAGAQVRHPVWRGWQPVAGVWLAAGRLSAPHRLERILRLWAPGCRAWRFDEGDVLCFEAPRPMQCEHAGGAPLCAIGAHGLFAGPLTASERAALMPADVHLVIGGRLRSLSFAAAEALDPSTIIDIGDYALHDTYACPQRGLPALRQERIGGKPVRELLGDKIPPPSAERAAFLRSLADRGRSERPGLGERLVGLRDSATLWVLRGAAALLRGGGAASAGGRGGPSGRGGAGGVSARARPAQPQRWRAWMTRLAMASGTARLFGLRQGAYLRRLLEQFDRGDLMEALRHALPIDGQDGASLGQGFGTPGRRDHLGLSTGVGGHLSIGLGDAAREYLRERYRRAFDTLDRQGKTDEALFVLAELLNARQEAIDYLIKHERTGQAAELALGWDLPADTIIRLLMLAGDRERAVLVARRDNAFGAAVAMLESAHPAHALSLRREWGQALVEQGRWLAAVDAVWPDPDSREQAGRWLLAAESAGAELSARALAQRAALLPDTLRHYRERIAELADPSSPVSAARAALGQALAECAQPNPTLRQLAGRVLPALAADRAMCANELSRAQLTQLRALSDDPWLRADLPAFQVPAVAAPQSLWQSRSAIPLRMSESAGLHAPHDIAALDDGRLLVALGEAGAAVYDRAGRCVRRYAVPAFKLVIGDSGQIALALAQRDSVWRIARLDLVDHRITDLGAMRLQSFADRFDGIAWSVVSGERIASIDATAPSLDVLWSVGDLGGPIVGSRYLRNDELFLVASGAQLAMWHYRTAPRRALVSREPLPRDLAMPVLMDPQWLPQTLELLSHHDGNLVLGYRDRARNRRYVELDLPWTGDDPDFRAVALNDGFALIVWNELRLRVFLVQRNDDPRCVAIVDWPLAPLGVREQGRELVLFDPQGRVMRIDTATSRVSSLSLL